MKLISWFKRFRLRQILTVFLASALLFVSTACSAVNATKASDVREDLPPSATDSTAKGGINVYPDTDPRKDTSRADTKAKALIDNAESQVIDESGDVVGNTKRILEKKGENLKEVGQNAKEDASKIPSATRNTAQELSNKAQSNVDEAVDATQEVGRKAQRAAENASGSAKSGVNQAVKSTQRAVQDASDAVQSGANQATKSTQRALEDTADTLN
ncbi:MAG: DUF6658 family protein [Cyanophyceae cyanobacterium]